jgi:hypothetical protein
MYMAERLSYYQRQKEAMDHPDTTMSCISDGMAQNHCKLPYMSGLTEFSEPLGQHLQVLHSDFYVINITRLNHIRAFWNTGKDL